MDFKIENDYDGNGKKSKTNNTVVQIIIISIVSIIVGLGVFFVFNSLFNKKEPVKEEPTEVDVSLTDKNVQILYQYVTYGTDGVRGEKFVKDRSVSLGSFTNDEKLFYALQFAEGEDFEFTGEYDENKKKIYRLPIETVKNYAEIFFGPNVSFAAEGVNYTHAFNFTINDQNIGTLTYDSDEDEFHVVFDGFQDIEKKTTGVLPYYTKLIGATKLKDNTLILKEKVVYVKENESEDSVSLTISKDFEHNSIMDTKSNISKESIDDYQFDISPYLENASTITYTFKVNNNAYYFASSEITG